MYNAVSKDGFVARVDGSEDFIPDEAWDDFLELLGSYDAVVMGRRTYEAIQQYPRPMIEAFEKISIKRVIVSREEQFHPEDGYLVTSSLSEIPKVGVNVLLTAGPTLNSAALKEGMIDRVMLNILPELIGVGLPVFNQPPKLVLLSTKEALSGGKMCTYQIQM